MTPVVPTPFHDGERRAQALAGGGASGTGIRAFMPDQHRTFFTLLPCLFLAVADDNGWPWATAVTGSAGFIISPHPNLLQVRASLTPDDPVSRAVRADEAIGLLGLQFETRRRNRANGVITAADAAGFTVAVSQSFGNCAKYIQTRDVAAKPPASIVGEAIGGLDDEARALIATADTFFVASSTPGLTQGGLDISHRGGRPGFVRVEGDDLWVPDFAGNRYFNTLGNLLIDPRAGLLFLDFARGDMLHVQGRASIEWHSGAAAPNGTERVWRLAVTRAHRRRAALPLQFTFREYSPASLGVGIW
jgi:predicted pyridoxine 5'-phosphate oxidase superfamily flavin-nucleotide-binding protein